MRIHPSLLLLITTVTCPWTSAQQHLQICEQKVDWVFVLDGSGSVGKHNFAKVKGAVVDFVSYIPLHVDTFAYIAALVYGSRVRDIMEFGDAMIYDTANQALLDFTYPSSGTATYSALKTMTDMFRIGGRENATRVGVIITDGRSNSKELTIRRAHEANTQNDVILATVGIGFTIDEDELTSVATKPELVHYYQDFNKLVEEIEVLALDICGNIGELCRRPLDIVFAVDGSTSRGPVEFAQIQTTLQRMILPLAINSDNGAAISIVVFSTGVTEIVPFKPYLKKGELLQRIGELSWQGGRTDISIGLEVANELFLREGRLHAEKVLVIFTDGWSTNDTQTIDMANVLKRNSVIILTADAEGSANVMVMQSVASSPALAFLVSDHISLESLGSAIGSSLCNVTSQHTPPTSAQPSTEPDPVNIISSSHTPVLRTSIYTNIPVEPTALPVYDPCDYCTWLHGVGYMSYEGDCTKFIQCERNVETHEIIGRWIMTCPVSLFWDQNTLVCNYPVKTYCADDPCRVTQSFASWDFVGNCRSFWSCEFGHTKELMCCGVGQRYTGTQCELDVACTHTCPTDENNTWVANTTVCQLLAIPEVNNQYMEIFGDGTTSRHNCPFGKGFSAAACGCTLNLTNPVCRPDLKLDFHTRIQDMSGLGLAVMHENVLIQPVLGAEDGFAGAFYGNSRVLVWRFSNHNFGKNIFIRVRFRPFGFDPPEALSNMLLPQALVTNAGCLTTPSVVMAYDNAASDLIGIIDTVGRPVWTQVRNSVDGSGWIDAVYRYREPYFTLRTFTGLDLDITPTLVTGNIKRQRTALQIGFYNCNPPLFSNFTGYIDTVAVYFCQP